MEDQTAAWAAIAVSIAGLGITYLTYRRRHGRRELSFVVTANAALVPSQLEAELKLSHDGKELPNPGLAVVRLVSTGDLEIQPSHFETPLTITFGGVSEIASAVCSATRPRDLQPELEIDGNALRIKPRLINPKEMIEVQVLSAGHADEISVEGRVAKLKLKRLAGLPYPPGMGKEGEFIGSFDYAMIWLVPQILILGFGGSIALGSGDYSTATRVLLVGATLIVAAAYYMWTRYLVDRRALWRPPAADETRS